MSQISRRSLRFDSIDQMFAEIEFLVTSESNAGLRSVGCWTLGQALNHLAAWVDYGFEGLPIKVPFLIKKLAPLMKKRVLAGPLKAGVRIPKTPGGTLATEVVATAVALPHLREAFSRLVRESPTLPHPLFGRLSHDEWIILHLRHAELHLSFLSPG